MTKKNTLSPLRLEPRAQVRARTSRADHECTLVTTDKYKAEQHTWRSLTLEVPSIQMATAPTMSSLAAPEWQNVLRSRITAQQAKDEVYKEMIGNCRFDARCCLSTIRVPRWALELMRPDRKLARTARDLKIRNRALLKGGAGTSGSAADG